MKTLFYSYWSHDPKYKAMAEECAASFERFGVAVKVCEIVSKNNWMKNCMARATQLRIEATVFHESAIVLLDADLTCMADPEILKTFCATDGDIAIHDKGPKENPSIRYCPGIMAFAPTPLGRRCLKDWAELCSGDPRPNEWIREQVYLCETIENLRKEGLRVRTLPGEYNCVRGGVPYSSPVILHYAASRELRKKVGGRL